MTSRTDERPDAGDIPDVFLADLDPERASESVRGMGLTERMIGAWQDMRASTRQLIDEAPSEPRLLFFVLLSDVIFFLARTLSLVVAPGSSAARFLPLEIGLWLIAILVVRTASLYVFSACVGAACRALGGQGSWRETRTGVFWASLVAAPVGVVGALLGAGMGRLEPMFPVLGSDAFVIAPLSIGVVAFVWFVSAGVAEAQQFRRTSPVFMAFSVLTVAAGIGAIALYASVIA